MLPLRRLHLLLLLVPLAVAGGLLVALLSINAAASPPAPPSAVPAISPLPPPAIPGLLVHVSGAVARPGVYRLQRGDRVSDAIAAAGGVTAAADAGRAPNLAGRLRDGQQVRVPALKGSAGTGGGSRASLNTATAEELATLPGFTSDLALQVVQYRQAFGPFSSTRQLVTELGMSLAAYALAKSHIGL